MTPAGLCFLWGKHPKYISSVSTTLQLFQSGTILHTTAQLKRQKQTKIRTIHSKSANCADFLMVAPAGVEPAMEESKSSALPLGDGASYKTVYHIFVQTTRAQTKKLSLHTAGRVFLYLSRLSHSGSWASTATRYSARSCWISCRCDPSAAVA